MTAAQVRETLSRLDRAGVRVERYLQVDRSRLQAWADGKRLPSRRARQLTWLSAFANALEGATHDVPACDHPFEPAFGALLATNLPGRFGGARPSTVSLYEGCRDMIEHRCARCSARNAAFDSRFASPPPMPAALPMSPGGIHLVGGLVGVAAAAPWILLSELPYLVAPAFVVGAVAAHVGIRRWCQVRL